MRESKGVVVEIMNVPLPLLIPPSGTGLDIIELFSTKTLHPSQLNIVGTFVFVVKVIFSWLSNAELEL